MSSATCHRPSSRLALDPLRQDYPIRTLLHPNLHYLFVNGLRRMFQSMLNTLEMKRQAPQLLNHHVGLVPCKIESLHVPFLSLLLIIWLYSIWAGAGQV